MPHKTKQIDILKQMFNNLPETDKQLFITEISSTTNIKKIIQPIVVSCCPHCKSSHFVKNGKFASGTQKYMCRACGKSFVERTGTILFKMKKDISVIALYIDCMLEKYTLRKAAKICNINLATAFYWRHKILDALQKMMETVELDGVVQADETYTNLSFKGNHKNFKLPRFSHKRGTPASKRGISNEQVCISVGVNLNGLSIGKVSNFGRPNIKDLESVLGGRISKGSIFVTDKLNSYQKLSYDMDLQHIRISSKKRIEGIFNIQTINNYHARLKHLIIDVFYGVSTKYLNNYIVYHNFVNFLKEPLSTKKSILLDFIMRTPCISNISSISKKPAIPI